MNHGIINFTKYTNGGVCFAVYKKIEREKEKEKKQKRLAFRNEFIISSLKINKKKKNYDPSTP